MTIRHKSDGGIAIFKEPGGDICRYCPLHPDTCKLASHAPGSVRQRKKEPECLIDWILWRLRSIRPAEALRIGDEAARGTIARRAKLLPYFYRRIEIYADRAAFVAQFGPVAKKEKTNGCKQV